jgi:hypothetical protein
MQAVMSSTYRVKFFASAKRGLKHSGRAVESAGFPTDLVAKTAVVAEESVLVSSLVFV